MHSCLYLFCQVFLYVNEDVTANMHVSECVSDNVFEFPHVHEYAFGNVQVDVLCLCAYEHVHLFANVYWCLRLPLHVCKCKRIWFGQCTCVCNVNVGG